MTSREFRPPQENKKELKAVKERCACGEVFKLTAVKQLIFLGEVLCTVEKGNTIVSLYRGWPVNLRSRDGVYTQQEPERKKAGYKARLLKPAVLDKPGFEFIVELSSC